MADGCVRGGSLLAMEPGAPPGHAMPCEGLRLGNAMPFCIPFSFAHIWEKGLEEPSPFYLKVAPDVKCALFGTARLSGRIAQLIQRGGKDSALEVPNRVEQISGTICAPSSSATCFNAANQ